MASAPIAQFNPSQSPNYGFIVPNVPSPNMRAFLAYVDALHTGNFKDVMASFDEALEHRILPQSLGRPVLNKRQYGEYLKAVMPLLKRFQITIHEVVEAGEKMTVHASSIGESITDAPYVNEYILVISFVPPPSSTSNNALPKMRFVKEFVDSAFSNKFYMEERSKAKLREEEQQKLNSRKAYARRGW